MTNTPTMSRACTLLLVLALGAGVCLAEEDNAAQSQALFDADAYLAHIRYLASDELGGRLPGTPGGMAAGEYVAEQFKKAGLKPGGVDNTYFQPFTVRRLKTLHEDRSSFEVSGLKQEWKVRRDWVPMPFTKPGALAGPLAFAGYGISASKHEYDDYGDFDATGKVLLILRYEPQDEDPNAAFGGTTPSHHALFSRKARIAAKHGAKGLLIVNPPNRDPDDDQLYPWDDSQTSRSYSLPIAHVSRAVANAILAQAGQPDLKTLQERLDRERKPLSTDLEGVSVKIETGVEGVQGRNVLGLLEGKERSDEYVVIGAHYDHLGTVPARGSESGEPAIHNGADDNASGTAGVIELARVFAAGPRPRRSIVFMTYDAEELGLLGSSHFVEHPTVELEQIVAMFNFDMIGRLNLDRLAVYGVGSGTGFRELIDASAEKLDLTYQAPASGSGVFGGSDHHPFYQNDIPVLFAFTGIHKQYHTPEDDWELIDKQGATKVLQMLHPVISALANQPERPAFINAAEEAAARSAREANEQRSEAEAEEQTEPNPTAAEQPPDHGRPRVVLGIIPDRVYEGADGLRVFSVVPGGPAARAGLQDGDIITSIADQPVRDTDSYMEILRPRQPGDEVSVAVKRGEQQLTLKVKLAER